MFFTFDGAQSIHVPFPFQRVMTPYMMPDTASCPIDFSVHMTELQPGAIVDEHIHKDGMEAMYCLSGRGSATVGDETYDFTPDSMVAAAPNEKHGLKNTGDQPMRMLCIFSPPVTADFLRKRASASMEEYARSQKK